MSPRRDFGSTQVPKLSWLTLVVSGGCPSSATVLSTTYLGMCLWPQDSACQLQNIALLLALGV